MAAQKVAKLTVPDAAEYDRLEAVRGNVPVQVGDFAWPRVVQECDACVLDSGSVRTFRFNQDSDLQGRAPGAQCKRSGDASGDFRHQQPRQPVHRYGAEFIEQSEYKTTLPSRRQLPHQRQVSVGLSYS